MMQQKSGHRRILVGLATTAVVFIASCYLPLHFGSSGTSTAVPDRARRRLIEQLPPGLASASAGLHGMVQKEGPLNMHNWHRNHTLDRRQAFAKWLGARGLSDVDVPASKAAGLQDTGTLLSPPPVYPSCQLFINHRYRFVYVRHAMAASASLLDFFGYCGGQQADSTNSSCLERMDMGVGQRITADELEALWRDYFVFSFVRNPWARLANAYTVLMRSLVGGAGPGVAVEGDLEGGQEQPPAEGEGGGQLERQQQAVEDGKEFGWDDFCADPASFQRACDQHPGCSSTAKVTAGRIQAQLPCLTTAAGGWAVDYLGRVEDLDADLQAVLDQLDARRGPGVPQLDRPQKRLGITGGKWCRRQLEGTTLPLPDAAQPYCGPEKLYTGRHVGCAQLVRTYFSADVGALQFPGGSTPASSSS